MRFYSTKSIRLCGLLLFGILFLNNTALASDKHSQEPSSLETYKTISLQVPDMTCPVCPITIKKALKATAGVQTVTVSFEDKIVTVTFDPSQVTIEALINVIGQAGYSATRLPT